MPSLGFAEILIILVFALLVFGPKKLPEIGRAIGRSMKEFRKASAEIRAELDLDLDDEPPRVPSPSERARAAKESTEARSPNGDASPAIDQPEERPEGGERPTA